MTTKRAGRSRRAGGERGFTLIELVVGVAMMMIIFTMAMRIVSSSTTQSRAITDMSQQQADSRRALLDLVGDLREAWTGDENALHRVAAATATAITFYAPDRSALTNASGQAVAGGAFRLRKVKYQLDTVNAKLQRSVTTSTNTAAFGGTAPVWSFPADTAYVDVLTGVRSTSLFAYTDKLGAPLTAPIAVSSIRVVTVSIDVDRALGAGPGSKTFSTSVQLRGDLG
jgi:Tfp pilus assembly protein PilW